MLLSVEFNMDMPIDGPSLVIFGSGNSLNVCQIMTPKGTSLEPPTCYEGWGRKTNWLLTMLHSHATGEHNSPLNNYVNFLF